MPQQKARVSRSRAGKGPHAQRGNNKSRPNKGAGNGSLVPRQPQRDRLNQIQELWTPLYPATIVLRLRYAGYAGGLTATSGALTSYVYSANGLFDPDITSTGHQPMGFDQVMLSYEHYVVLEARMVATFKNTNGSSNPAIALSVQPSPTPVGQISQLIEYGAIQRDVLEFKGVSGSMKTLEAKVNITHIMGLRNIVDVTDLQGTLTANPTEQTYFMLSIWDTSGITANVDLDVMIEYRARFTEPRTLSASITRSLRTMIVSEQKR